MPSPPIFTSSAPGRKEYIPGTGSEHTASASLPMARSMCTRPSAEPRVSPSGEVWDMTVNCLLSLIKLSISDMLPAIIIPPL